MYVIECPHLSLDKIFASGQVPRWRRMSDGKYLVTDGEQAVKVVQSRSCSIAARTSSMASGLITST